MDTENLKKDIPRKKADPIRRKKIIRICAGGAGAVLLLFGICKGVGVITGNKTDTKAGVDLIKKQESADLSAIESKIGNLDSQSGDQDRSLKEQFASTVIMGDSITEGFAQYDVLNSSSVIAKIGVELTGLDDQIAKLKEVNPQYVFLSYGLNDVTATNGDTATFTSQYQSVIEKIQKEVPGAKIFVNSIFPVESDVVSEQPLYKDIDAYNEALQALCDKLQLAYVDNTALSAQIDYEEDGIHMKADFYPIWARYMAEVAAL